MRKDWRWVVCIFIEGKVVCIFVFFLLCIFSGRTVVTYMCMLFVFYWRKGGEYSHDGRVPCWEEPPCSCTNPGHFPEDIHPFRLGTALQCQQAQLRSSLLRSFLRHHFPFSLSLTHSTMTTEVGFSFWSEKMLRPLQIGPISTVNALNYNPRTAPRQIWCQSWNLFGNIYSQIFQNK